MTDRRRGLDPEAGESLIEILMAVVIISIAAVALLGALIGGITGSVEHRGLTVEETILKSSAETLKNQVQQQGHFVACEAAAGPDYVGYLPSTPSGYTTPAMTVQWWNNSTGQFEAATGSCTSNQNSGIQLITLSTNSTSGHVPESLAFVVRHTAYAPSE